MKQEKDDLSTFLPSRLQVILTVRGDVFVLDTGDEKLPLQRVKMLLKKFLHQQNLEAMYKVMGEQEAARIVKQKRGQKQKSRKEGNSPFTLRHVTLFFPQSSKAVVTRTTV
jgi:hypothetical protein